MNSARENCFARLTCLSSPMRAAVERSSAGTSSRRNRAARPRWRRGTLSELAAHGREHAEVRGRLQVLDSLDEAALHPPAREVDLGAHLEVRVQLRVPVEIADERPRAAGLDEQAPAPSRPPFEN